MIRDSTEVLIEYRSAWQHHVLQGHYICLPGEPRQHSPLSHIESTTGARNLPGLRRRELESAFNTVACGSKRAGMVVDAPSRSSIVAPSAIISSSQARPGSSSPASFTKSMTSLRPLTADRAVRQHPESSGRSAHERVPSSWIRKHVAPSCK